MLVFVAAEAREFAGFLRHADRVERLDWPLDFARQVTLSGRTVALVANGPGPKLAGRAAEVAKENVNLDNLVSTGFCGALSPRMKFCEVFSVNQVMTLGGPARAGDPKLLSIDRVIASAREKAELHRTTGADAVEMEAAAIAERAESWKVPFRAIRVVSDSAEESLPLDFNRMRDADGRFSRARIVGAALRHPSVFPRLLRLDQRSKLAAEALGDFIADTRF